MSNRKKPRRPAEPESAVEVPVPPFKLPPTILGSRAPDGSRYADTVKKLRETLESIPAAPVRYTYHHEPDNHEPDNDTAVQRTVEHPYRPIATDYGFSSRCGICGEFADRPWHTDKWEVMDLDATDPELERDAFQREAEPGL